MEAKRHYETHFRNLARCDPLLSELSAQPLYKHTSTDESHSIVVIPSNSNLDSENSQYTFRIAHSDAQTDWMELLQNKESIWFLYGFVIYQDVFGKKHEARFCSKLDNWPKFALADVGPLYNRHT